jgi:hypothetical protein
MSPDMASGDFLTEFRYRISVAELFDSSLFPPYGGEKLHVPPGTSPDGSSGDVVKEKKLIFFFLALARNRKQLLYPP